MLTRKPTALECIVRVTTYVVKWLIPLEGCKVEIVSFFGLFTAIREKGLEDIFILLVSQQKPKLDLGGSKDSGMFKLFSTKTKFSNVSAVHNSNRKFDRKLTLFLKVLT